MKKPAFTGEIPVDLTIGLFGETVARQATLTYSYTPEWSHYDPIAHTEQVGDFAFGLGLLVLADPIPQMPLSAKRKSPPSRWIRCDKLLYAGVIAKDAYDQLLVRIEREAINADRINRVMAKMPVPPIPKQH
jgi:hypothetical protein